LNYLNVATENVNIVAAAPTGLVAMSYSTGPSITYVKAESTATIININFTGFSSLPAVGQSTTFTYIMTNGSTVAGKITFAYINGSGVGVKTVWANGVVPAPSLNSTTVYTFTVIALKVTAPTEYIIFASALEYK
jgi:hypothetical protein